MVAAVERQSELGQGVLPAGGVDPVRFDWREVWYPVAYLQDLDKAKLTQFTLLNQDLVIWWDPVGEAWRAFDDKCPHRLAPLSEGRVAEDGRLECPYHGWAFSGSGACERIPQQQEGGQAHQSRRACVTSLPTAERQGLLFVYPGQAENADRVDIPTLDAIEEDPDEWVVLNTFRDLPYDALTLMENVLDSSHIPYTHHKSVGNRSYASPVELEVLQTGRQGFKGYWEEGPRKGSLGSQTTEFIAPGLMWHDLTSEQFGRTMTVVYATPIRRGECRLFARFPFKFNSKLPRFLIRATPRWYSHLGNNGVLEDDQIFLHVQERYLEQLGGRDRFSKAYYLPTAADSFVSELHKWVVDYQAEPFPHDPLPLRIPTDEQLLERYHSHTKHCASCRTALKRLQRIRLGAAITAALGWSIAPVLATMVPSDGSPWVITSTIIALMGGSLWLGLGRLEQQFYEGRLVPPRNQPS